MHAQSADQSIILYVVFVSLLKCTQRFRFLCLYTFDYAIAYHLEGQTFICNMKSSPSLHCVQCGEHLYSVRPHLWHWTQNRNRSHFYVMELSLVLLRSFRISMPRTHWSIWRIILLEARLQYTLCRLFMWHNVMYRLTGVNYDTASDELLLLQDHL